MAKVALRPLKRPDAGAAEPEPQAGTAPARRSLTKPAPAAEEEEEPGTLTRRTLTRPTATTKSEETRPARGGLVKRDEAPAPVVAEEEEEEEEEETVDQTATLKALDRSALKQLITSKELDIRVVKSMTDDDLRAAIVAARPAATPPEEEEEEERDAGGALAVKSAFKIGEVTGELDPTTDYVRPRLELVQNVGPLVEECEPPFTPGQIVLAKEVLIWEKGCAPLEIIVMAVDKIWVEKLAYGSEEMPRIFKTLAEAQAEGLTAEWVDDEPPTVNPTLNCLVLIKQPDYIEPHALFSYDIGGGDWAMAEWRISTSKAYRSAGRYILGARKTSLKDGLHTGFMKLIAERQKGQKAGSATSTVPKLTAGGKFDEDTIATIIGIVS